MYCNNFIWIKKIFWEAKIARNNVVMLPMDDTAFLPKGK